MAVSMKKAAGAWPALGEERDCPLRIAGGRRSLIRAHSSSDVAGLGRRMRASTTRGSRGCPVPGVSAATASVMP